ncbi:hypothetical protein ACFFV7_16185 [Nonomuraea spiralis]|uniref:Transmembrane protein n=1 Tax=Nonomuraea spiralis TaxID=46182 RepID=A0ABV5IDW9_9ACTN|nr:hypothetical protein [Nonomuraea spiralis]GGS67951.1 hypothetical protein GCM10010176_007900 [Nonomuraea spiralis]
MDSASDRGTTAGASLSAIAALLALALYVLLVWAIWAAWEPSAAWLLGSCVAGLVVPGAGMASGWAIASRRGRGRQVVAAAGGGAAGAWLLLLGSIALQWFRMLDNL